jgi:hypothetical protein
MAVQYLSDIIMKNPNQKDISESMQNVIRANKTGTGAVVLVPPSSRTFLRMCKITGFGL